MKQRTNYKIRFALILTLVGSITILGCKKDEDDSPKKPSSEVYNPQPYVFNIPKHIPGFYVPEFNKTTVQGVELGRRIYYDKMLSLGGPLEGNACASCHAQTTNFADNATGLSVMPHTNLMWTEDWLWNGAEKGTLEDVMLFEINKFFKADISLFQADSTYQKMNYLAFGNDSITDNNMAFALAQWLRTLISADSRFDRYYQGQESLTELELRGEELFNTEQADCFHCHSAPLTTDLLFHNNGLDSIPEGIDLGRFNVTDDPADRGRFKTPSLRNVEMTAPYMHDGRFQTLEQVVEFYNSGVKHSNTLDPIMTKPEKIYGLNLTQYDKDALVAFLKTFTDEAFLKNSAHSDPFE